MIERKLYLTLLELQKHPSGLRIDDMKNTSGINGGLFYGFVKKADLKDTKYFNPETVLCIGDGAVEAIETYTKSYRFRFEIFTKLIKKYYSHATDKLRKIQWKNYI